MMNVDALIYSLLYVSTSLIAAGDVEPTIRALVDFSRDRNALIGITGCLVFARGRFGQYLEGDRRAVELLMSSIQVDPRHCNISILDVDGLASRRFDGWTMGYAGPSYFVEQKIAASMIGPNCASAHGVSELLRLMTAFHQEQLRPA